MKWIALASLLGLACRSPAPAAGPIARIEAGDADTITVYDRLPVQLPVRALDATGHEVANTPFGFTWLSGDSIPVSSSGAAMCHRRGSAAIGVTLGMLFRRIEVRCVPVRSVRMAGPLNLLAADSTHRLVAEVLGLDGRPVEQYRGAIEILRPSVVRVAAGRVLPLAPGGTLLTLTVGGESATIAVHVFEPVATLNGLRPEQDHVAVPLQLARGESVGWPLPAGTWIIAMQPNEPLPAGLRLEVEGAGCQAMRFPRGSILCRSTTTSFLRVALDPSTPGATLNTHLLLRRTRA